MMMSEFEKTFLHKNCFVRYQNFNYNGKIVSVSEDIFMIEDDKTGEIVSLPIADCMVRVKA